MLKKTITYVDYDGNERTEDKYFNLNQTELMELQLSTSGGLEQAIRKIISEQDMAKLVSIFKEIILKAYGEKSPDGRRFIKNKELTEDFTQTEAYNKLFMELATNADAAADFINGIMPDDLKSEMEKQKANIPAPALSVKDNQ